MTSRAAVFTVKVLCDAQEQPRVLEALVGALRPWSTVGPTVRVEHLDPVEQEAVDLLDRLLLEDDGPG